MLLMHVPTQLNTWALKCTDTAAYPYRSFHFNSKRQLNITELNCSLHSQSKTPPPPFTWILDNSNRVQYKY